MQYLDIQHDIINHLFFLRTGSGVARLRYTNPKDGVIKLTETYVPTKDREKGIGGALVDSAINYARGRRLSIKSECSFATDYLSKEAPTD